MSVKCDICGKKPLRGNLVSHANNRTKRRYLPNLQKVNAVIDGARKKINVCTRCIKQNKVVKAI